MVLHRQRSEKKQKTNGTMRLCEMLPLEIGNLSETCRHGPPTGQPMAQRFSDGLSSTRDGLAVQSLASCRPRLRIRTCWWIFFMKQAASPDESYGLSLAWITRSVKVFKAQGKKCFCVIESALWWNVRETMWRVSVSSRPSLGLQRAPPTTHRAAASLLYDICSTREPQKMPHKDWEQLMSRKK